jgi:acetyl-CoA carboxylase biotin carboxyl carrier protein
VIDLEQIRELLKLMAEHDLGEIKVRQGETVIALRKTRAGEPVVYAAPAPTFSATAPGGPLPAAGPVPAEPAKDEGLTAIVSPMVGTVYLAPDPESPPYVSAGREVDPSSPVCVIEAMKVFNEIRAEVSGTIERILVQNEQAVEFGQPLMMVRPKG